MIDGAHTSNYARFLVAVLCLATVSGLGCDAVPRANLGDSGGFGAPTAALEGAEAGGADQIARAIEEADIIKIVGDTIYALNRFKGLLIVDVSDPDDP
ncbi:MAG: hypothetical protein JXQ75_14470, partial [Phycisphaerae bacterium]|nr:hypothetical protein [Phycisphaerae bacterium]